jgi:hypothetical protein
MMLPPGLHFVLLTCLTERRGTYPRWLSLSGVADMRRLADGSGTRIEFRGADRHYEDVVESPEEILGRALMEAATSPVEMAAQLARRVA